MVLVDIELLVINDSLGQHMDFSVENLYLMPALVVCWKRITDFEDCPNQQDCYVFPSLPYIFGGAVLGLVPGATLPVDLCLSKLLHFAFFWSLWRALCYSVQWTTNNDTESAELRVEA